YCITRRAILNEYSELEQNHLDKPCFTDSNTEQLHSDFERRKRIHRNRNSEITLGGRGEKLQRKHRPRVTIGWPSYLERKRREAQEIQVKDQQNLEEQKRIDTD
ncbi:unnamed protein product, partial [Brassica oleracea]